MAFMNPTTSQVAVSRSDSGVYALTADGAGALRAELVRLRETKERDISQQLREARAFGDPGANDEYMAIREEEMVLDARIASLEGVLARASVIDAAGLERDVVSIGSTVTVEDRERGSRDRYSLVGMHGQIRAGEVSVGSPIGRALLGRRSGDIVEVELPGGHIRELRVVATDLVRAGGGGLG